MAISFTTPGDAYIAGGVYFSNLFFLGGTGPIVDAMVNPAAAIQATKLQQQREVCLPISVYGSAPAAVRKTLARVNGTAGSVAKFSAGVTQAITGGTVTIDLFKNGSSILSAAIVLNSTAGTGGTAGDVVAGVIATPTLAAGDKLEVSVTVSSPVGGGGCDAQLIFTENPS